MKIIHRYILKQYARNLILALLVFMFLFIVFDLFDRMDDFLEHDAELGSILQYFLFKIPLNINFMLPVAVLVSTMLTIGLLSKNSELTAMRAGGLTIFWLARPMLVLSFVLSVGSIIFAETVVPYSTRRVNEVFNIDIRKKDLTGNYSRNDFWWRSRDKLYSANFFDSRSNTLYGLTQLRLGNDFVVLERTEADAAKYVDDILGWSMSEVEEYRFEEGVGTAPEVNSLSSLPLPIDERPQDFYDAKTDPFEMGYFQLKRFIADQSENGIETGDLLANLYAKVSFPFIIFVVTLLALPFALKPARTGSMAPSFLAGLIIGLGYYAVHSIGLALGRAEIWPPLLAAWCANLVMGFIGLILNLGSERPA